MAKRSTNGRRKAKLAALNSEISAIDERIRVCGQALREVDDLIRLAKAGHPLPVGTLVMLTHIMVHALNSIADSSPESLWPWSRHAFVWPAHISRKREFRRANEKLMSDLHLGKGGVYSNRKWQLSAPSTQGALSVIINALARRDALNLPVLTRATKETWFEASWNDLIARGIRPEEGNLKPLGEAAIKPKRAVKHANLRGMSKQTEGMKRDDLRAEIKRQVRKAFNTFVGDADPIDFT